MAKTIDLSILNTLLRYESETGKLFWKKRPEDMPYANRFNAQFAGKEALYGIGASHGYKSGAIFNTQVLAHRVIWAMHFGEWPNIIDHINGDKLDNRIENLRNVTRCENAQNMKRASNNKSGAAGVYWAPHAGKWRAAIKVEKKSKHLGYFDCVDDAAKARRMADRQFGYHPNHGRES